MDMGLCDCSEKALSLAEVRNLLEINIRKDAKLYFGVNDNDWVKHVTDNWFNDQENYDGRWKLIKERIPKVGRVLDMASGCGTFLLYGLHNEYDVWGIEPEEWKREYFRKKVIASKYPEKYLYRVVAGVGEALPFENESFDLVTTYQTLEHVSDVNRCIQEMLRVLKQEGILYVKAPDYNCFFEPHYRVPFLPKMNKKLASVYLKLIRRPLLGLQDLQWITEKEVIKFLEDSKYKLKIERTKDYRFFMRQRKIKELLPKLLQNMLIISFVNYIYETKAKLIKLAMIGRIENNIDLWITKVG